MKKIKVQTVDSQVNQSRKKIKSANLKYKLKVYSFKYIPIFLFLFVLNLNFLISLLFSVGWWFIATIFYDHRSIRTFNPIIRIWFGVPGSGKTSVGAWLSRESIKSGVKVLSNVPIQDTYKLEESDLGNIDMSFDGLGCHVIYDEATINGLDNRGFKEFSKTKKPLYFSIHRHMDNMIDVFSQGYDIDLKIKDRAGENGLFHLSKIGLKGFVKYRRISKVFFIKKDDKQFIDGFKYAGLPRILYTKSVWNTFDTKDMSLCPTNKKQWELWNFDED